MQESGQAELARQLPGPFPAALRAGTDRAVARGEVRQRPPKKKVQAWISDHEQVVRRRCPGEHDVKVELEPDHIFSIFIPGVDDGFLVHGPPLDVSGSMKTSCAGSETSTRSACSAG